MDIDNLTITKLVMDLKLAAENCPRCAGSRETIFTSRGRDNIVNCLECEPIYQSPGDPGSRPGISETEAISCNSKQLAGSRRMLSRIDNY